MADTAFETRLARVLESYADDVVVPIDASAIALAARASDRGPLARLRRLATAGPTTELRLVFVAAALLTALVIGTLLVGGSQRQQPSLVDVVATPPAEAAEPTSTPSASAVDPSGLPVALAGRWIATAPNNLVLSGRAVANPFVFAIDGSGRQAYLERPDGGLEMLLSDVSSDGADALRFVKRPSQTEEVIAGGQSLGACTPGDEGTYRVVRSPDGLLLTLEAIDDDCGSRAAVLARTWTRSLGGPSTGGTGVIDALDRHIVLTLPAGSYTVNRFPGGFGVQQAAPEFEFLAWRNPQGFNDPCDPVDGGRRPVADAADFVDYFRALPGFTVDSVTATEIDGRPATNLRLHANDDASCPDGRLAEWQPEELADRSANWFLRPGDSDSLYLVDLGETTLMFQVLASSPDLEAQIIPSIRILEDGLPTSP